MIKMVVLRIVSILFISSLCHSLINNDYKVINKLPRSPLMKYHSYASVMILHYYIPSDVTNARFEFKALDQPTSMFVSKCTPRNISVYMKPGSYPVITPEGVPLPETFLNITRPEIHELTLLTDKVSKYIYVSSPKPGDWFAVSFVSWSDPRKDKIEQQGLTSKCKAYLYSELAVIQNHNIETISPNKRTNIDIKQHKNPLFKFYVHEDIDHVLIEVDIETPCKDCDYILIFIETGVVPNENKYQEKLLIEGNTETKKYFYFWPEEDNWHYLNISLVNNNENATKYYSEIAITLKYISGLQEEFYTPKTPNITDKRINLFKTSIDKKIMLRNKSLQYSLPYKQYNLMRITDSENFVFEYDFRPHKKNETVPLFLNITSSEMTVLKFMVQEIVDIGGTLSLVLAIKPNIFIEDNDNDVKYKIVGCIRANSREVPTFPDLCVHNNNATKAPIVLNSTSKGTLEFFHLPYPEPGMYYLSIRAFYDSCVPCNCSETCEQFFEDCILNCELNCTTSCSSCTEQCENDTLERENCEYCNCDGNCWKGNDTNKNTSLIFTIGSNPCIHGSCGPNGDCNDYIAGGFIFSACFCHNGYRGWDCSDGSHVLSGTEVLVAVLLLTLSNLLFIPSIYFAYKRGYYAEALTYFCSMLSSTMYHACDSKQNQYGYCILSLSVLQFSDFYCGLLTIWVTLIAMAHTTPKVNSAAHIVGAIILAFSVTYNRYALWVFVLPAVFGIVLIAVNWGFQCMRTKKLFPSKKYLKLNIPIGGVLVITGLISYAFLETKENYKIIHSLWHVAMALSLIFLIPNNKSFVPIT